MKKLLIAAAMATALTGINAQAASTGTITFAGKLTDSTCTVSVDGQGADATINLPAVSTSSLGEAAKTAGETSFNMALTDCTLAEGETGVSAFFDTGTTVTKDGRLRNTTTKTEGGATNVTLQLRDLTNNAGKDINIGNDDQKTAMEYATVSEKLANLSYSVRYYAEDATTAGTVNSSVVYSLQYK